MAKSVRVGLLKHQMALMRDVESPRIGLVAGVGAGKTRAAAMKALQLSALNYPAIGLIAEPTYPMVRDVLIPTLRSVLDDWGAPHFFNVKDSNLFARFNGVEIKLLLRNTSHALRLAGMNLSHVVIDEAEQHAEDAVKQLSMRIRVAAPHRQFIAVGTPEGVGGWFHRWFELEPDAGTRLIRARTQDNHHLPEDFIRTQLGHLSSQEMQRYVEGRFVSFRGRVYTQCEPSVHFAECEDPGEGEQYMACDFGRAMVWLFVRAVGDVVHVWGEQALEGIDTIEAAKRARAYLAAHFSRAWGRPVSENEAAHAVTVHCDPAGGPRFKASASDVKILEDHGFHVLVKRRHPAIKDRVNAVQQKFAARELFIDPVGAPYAARCFESQEYGEDGLPKKGRPREGLRGLDHGPDALGYLVEWYWPCARTDIQEGRYH